ncbi:MAG: hypothetical protein GY869_01040 [Planctomycetes bacterium]|nr:hypothetical protein [Planctomycetota bacterium]
MVPLNKFSISFLCICIFALTVTSSYAQTPWKFIAVGDSRSNGENNGVNIAILNEIAHEIVSHNVDFVLFPGDMVNGSSNPTIFQSQLNTWRDTMQPVYDAGIGVYPVRGNHENYSLTAWRNVFTGPYALPQNGPAAEIDLTYSVSHKNAFIVALDQYVTLRRVNQTWLDSQFADNSNPHVFVIGHEPAFAVHHADCLDDYPINRDDFWLSLKNEGCRIYFCGHDHFYDHALIDDLDGNPNNDIHQYVVGTAGAPLRSWSPPYSGDNSSMIPAQHHHAEEYGYLVVEVTDTGYSNTWYQRQIDGSYSNIINSPDIDHSGFVNLIDYAALTSSWLTDNCTSANNYCNQTDFDWNTSVNQTELMIMSNSWLTSIPLVYQVTDGSDDAEQRADHTMYLDSTDLELVYDSGNQTVGLRFNQINLPQGATIANACLLFAADEANSNICNLTISGQYSGNASTFTSTPYDISSRPKTSTSIPWSPPNWTIVQESNSNQQTPNLAPIIQEITNHPNWTLGNSIILFITGTGERTAEAFEGNTNTAPRLIIQQIN